MISATHPRMTTAAKPGPHQDSLGQRLVAFQHALKARVEVPHHALKKGNPVSLWASGLVMNAHKRGAEERNHRHRENVRSKDRQHHAQCQAAAKMYLLTPERNVTGKNTIDVVDVAASTASETSIPPFSAASRGGTPISMKRKIFSSTTTESSISRENASASPPQKQPWC